MARPLRFEFEGAIYHVFTRGNDRRPIFVDEHDYKAFLHFLKQVSDRFSIEIPSYCLMPNHVHLQVHTPQANLSRAMKWLFGIYTMRFNRRHGHVGHLFQGRYGALLIDTDTYLSESSRYIHLNPVKAALCAKPEAFPWSSFSGILSGTHDASLVLQQFDSVESYRRFVYDGIESDRDIMNEVKHGAFLGSDEYVERMKGRLSPGGEVAHRRSLLAVPADVLEAAIVDLPRDIAIYALWRWGGRAQREIGERFSLSVSSVSKVIKKIDSSDDLELKSRIDSLAAGLSKFKD